MARQDPDHISSTDLFGEQVSKQTTSALRRRFIFPPFSVINTRDGEWQRRKRLWLKLGIQSELGRGTDIVPNGSRRSAKQDGAWSRSYNRQNKAAPGRSLLPSASYSKNRARGDGRGRPIASRREADRRSNVTNAPLKPEWATGTGTEYMVPGSSIFDPALCELMYTWFCPSGGMVVDAFAGGSVRGIVAATLGRRYWGAELRAEQVEANVQQRQTICPRADLTWMCGDSYDLLPDAPRADFLFTCPPYGDLEEYSDDPRDISTMTYGAFRKRFRQIVRRSVRRLKPDRFAAIVVGDFRDRKTGMLRGFVGDTVVAFEDAGLEFYNDIILITAVGSLPIRVRKQFEVGRKIGKTHQTGLVFVKGDPRKAAARCE